MKRKIDKIVIHCTATKSSPEYNYSVDTIRNWHKKRGFRDIGYHFLVRFTDVQPGRPIEEMGAHTKGFNKSSIGIAYYGGLDENGKPADTRTELQKDMLLGLLKRLKERFPNASIHGHRDLASVDKDGNGVGKGEFYKSCPCFEVETYYKDLQPSKFKAYSKAYRDLEKKSKSAK